jgi:hypothetical protein
MLLKWQRAVEVKIGMDIEQNLSGWLKALMIN